MANNKESVLLHQMGNFSQNMLQNHHLENLSEFVLHDLCSEQGFGIKKAAYLVNNPDFECLKGVAGYHHPESFTSGNCWGDQKQFTSHMQQSDFNKAVRSYTESIKDSTLSSDKVAELADRFQISDPAYYSWDAKHNNQGFFIYESLQDEHNDQDYLQHFLHMLSFCPIF